MLFKVNFSFHHKGIFGKAYTRVEAEDRKKAAAKARSKLDDVLRRNTEITDVRAFESQRDDNEAD